MAYDRDKDIVYRPLYESPIITVHDYCCHIAQSGPGAEEESDANNIVLMRHGAFARHFGRRTTTADVNQAVFFSRASTYRVSHPSDCGDRGTVFTVSPRVLNDIVRELDPSIDDHPEQPFRFFTGPCDSRVFWRHRELVQRLDAESGVDRVDLGGAESGDAEHLDQSLGRVLLQAREDARLLTNRVTSHLHTFAKILRGRRAPSKFGGEGVRPNVYLRNTI